MGCPKSILIERADDLDMAWMDGAETLGITAGASAPELLVQELITALKEKFDVTVREVAVTIEDVHFSLPRSLTA
jgi:4-hydroxy-3-methylbut-2-enyl diphosphate reductase